MAFSVDQFGKALVSAGLFTADELKALWNAIPADVRPKQGDGFAKLLVEQGRLNQFQADELLSGRNTPLVMGDYVLVAELGAGGMGKVYKARHRRMERIVALKVMSAAAMQDEAAVKRFQREVKAAARLEHPNIVTAYDSGEAGSVKYLVMQFVDGGDLSQLVKQSGPLEIERAVDYVLQAARGLGFAHGEGVVHRDIKPANLLLDKKGVVKILDMGLARIEGGDGLTATEQVMGTVDYMSPEQAANTKTADGRSDIYSLGCTLWYLLTAKKVYDGDTMISRLMSHRTDPLPSLVKARDDVPWSLEQAFHKMIAKSPEERFQSMDEVVAALEPFAPSSGSRSGVGSSIGMGPQSVEMASFLKSIGPAVKPQTKPAPTGTKVDVEATAQFAAAGADTDPKSQLLPPSKKAVPPQAKGSGQKPPPNKNLLLAAAGGGALLVLLGVWFIFRDKDGNETARVQMPDSGSVTVQQPAATGGPTPVAAATRPAVSFFLPNSTPASPSGTTSPPPAAPPAAVPSSNGVVYLDELQEKSYFGLGALEKAGRNPSDVATLSKYFPEASPVHALVVHPETSGLDKHRYAVTSIPRHKYMSRLVYDLDGKYAAFRSGFRVRTGGKDSPHLAEVWGDGKLLWESGDLVPLGVAGATADVDVRGVRELTLIVWGDAGKRAALLTEPRLTPVAPVPSGGSPGAKSRPINLLPLVDVTQDKIKGSWELKNGELHTGQDAGPLMLEFPYQPPEEYDFTVEFTYTSGGEIHQFLARQGRGFSWALGAMGFKFSGFERIDGKVVHENPTKRDYRPQFNQRHVSRVEVRNDGLRAYLDGNLIGEWKGDYRQLDAELDPRWPFWKRRDPSRLAIGTKETPTIFHKAEVVEVRGSGTFLRPPAPVAPPTNPPATTIAPQAAPPLAKAPFDVAQAKMHQAAWAKHLGTQVETVNIVGQKMILIPPGEFLMGSTDEQGEALRKTVEELKIDAAEMTRVQQRERPQHRVVITKPFRLSANEVTVGQFKKFVAATGYRTEAETIASNKYKQQINLNTATDDLLTAGITWNDAEAYCKWLSEQEKTTYRLPTEAEWEFACRAGTATQYSFGDDAALLDQYEWNYKNSRNQLQSAGTKLPNAFGLFDMHGSLHEWCRDYFAANWYGESPPNDPTGPQTGSEHVIRGGNYWPYSNALQCRSAYRGSSPAANRYSFLIGFRCVRELDVPATTVSVAPLPAALATTPSVTKPTSPAPPLAVAPFDAAQAKAHQQAWAKHLGTPVETVNSVGAKMILIPPGEFMMGSTDEQVEAALKVAEEINADGGAKGRIEKAERPQHKVVITKPFLLSSTEVTIGQFKQFSATGYVTEAEKAAPNDPRAQTYLSAGGDDLPAAYITWNDAVAYCQWLSTQEKTTYRLPTEAEWEYACRAGTRTQYSFGDDYNELSKYGWHKGNAGNKSHPVGTLLPNGFGLFDMHGNLYEWCGDYYDEKWYAASTPNDPSVGSDRVVRGGYWNHVASYCRSAFRYSSPPSPRSSYTNGFRCVSVLSVTPQPTGAAASSKLFMHDPAFPQWLKDVQAMPAEQQIEAVSKKLVELNPGFDGVVQNPSRNGKPLIQKGVVTGIGFLSVEVTDISPVRALAGLKELTCGLWKSRGKLSDLSPLSGLGLTSLDCTGTQVSDLSPLTGMPLTRLVLHTTKVSDLSSLKGMPLEDLDANATLVSDLSPLNGLPMKNLNLQNASKVSDLSPLRGMPLEMLNCNYTAVSDLSPLSDCKNLKWCFAKDCRKVTPAQVAALQKALPDCKIGWDDPAKPAAPAPAASGTK